MSYDVIIIGGGAAGLSAALWCAELDLSALLLEAETEFGGQLLRVYNRIENHLGCEAGNGRELRGIFAGQIEKRNLNIRLSSSVAEIDLEKKTVLLKDGEIVSAEFIIIASGVRRRKLNVAGEEKFQNKGIIESGARDGNSAKNKIAAIVGGGDAAFENALILSETATKVYLLTRQSSFRAREEFVAKALRNPKIEILTDTIVERFTGAERIERVEVKNLKTQKTQILPVQIVLIRIGVEPSAGSFRGEIDLDEKGYIKTNRRCETSVSGVFAVGDVSNPSSPTVSGAVGDGATAAKFIAEAKAEIQKRRWTE